MRDWLPRLKKLAWNYRNLASMRGLYLGVLAGLGSGTLACVYYYLLEGASHLLLTRLAGLATPSPAGEMLFDAHPGESRVWVLPLLLAATGLLTGYAIKRYLPKALGTGTDGTDAMILAFHRQQGRIRPFATIVRALASILTISCGGSAGREGPISLLGAGFGSYAAQKLKLSLKDRRILLLSGAAGGLGAIFRAPLGGALTAVEVLYKEDFEAEAVLPSIISSVTAYCIFSLVFGAKPIFSLPELAFHGLKEIPFYFVLALCCAFGASFFVRLFRLIKYRIFAPLQRNYGPVFTLGLGGFAMGLLGMFFPELTGGGFGWLEEAFAGRMSVTAMLLIFLGKAVATSCTVGCGLSGGTFAPVLVLGGMLGGALGQFAHSLAPSLAVQPASFALVGMTAFFSCAGKAPLGPLVMVCEITQGYGLLSPLMLCTAVGLVFSRGPSLYENQVDCRFDSPVHRAEFAPNILENLSVAEHIIQKYPVILEECINLGALVHILSDTRQNTFPVVNDKGELRGLLSLSDVRQVMNENCLFEVLVVRDLARPAVSLQEDQDLRSALNDIDASGFDELPVMSEKNNRVIGLLGRGEILRAYDQAMQELRIVPDNRQNELPSEDVA